MPEGYKYPVSLNKWNTKTVVDWWAAISVWNRVGEIVGHTSCIVMIEIMVTALVQRELQLESYDTDSPLTSRQLCRSVCDDICSAESSHFHNHSLPVAHNKRFNHLMVDPQEHRSRYTLVIKLCRPQQHPRTQFVYCHKSLTTLEQIFTSLCNTHASQLMWCCGWIVGKLAHSLWNLLGIQETHTTHPDICWASQVVTVCDGGVSSQVVIVYT